MGFWRETETVLRCLFFYEASEIESKRPREHSFHVRHPADCDCRRFSIATTAAQWPQSKNTCINNLRLIDAAIQQWALENNKTNSTDAPTWVDLKTYLARGGSEIPKCPSGGAYKLGTVFDKPTCTYPGHVLP